MGARHGAVYLAYVVDGGVKRHGVDRGITLGDAENGRLSIFSSIYGCACRRTKKRGLGRTEHAVTCGVPHQNIPRGRVLCFFEAGVEETVSKTSCGRTRSCVQMQCLGRASRAVIFGASAVVRYQSACRSQRSVRHELWRLKNVSWDEAF